MLCQELQLEGWHILSIRLRVHDNPVKLFLALKGGYVCFGLVAMAKRNPVVLNRVRLAIPLDIEEPVGIIVIASRELDVGAKDDISQKIKVLGIVFHVLLEVVWLHVGRVF